MARASGSYPAGRWFKSDIRYHSRLVGQAVKTRPFHGCNSGSIPLRVTNEKKTPDEGVFFSLVPLRGRPPRAMPGALCVPNIPLRLPFVRFLARMRFAFAAQSASSLLVSGKRANIRQRRNSAIPPIQGFAFAKSDIIATATVILKPCGFSDILFASKTREANTTRRKPNITA